MSDKNQNPVDLFLNAVRRSKTPVTMFLVKGVKLQGIITWFDNFSLLLRRDGQSQLVYKHAISTVMPSHDFDLAQLGDIRAAPAGKGKALQDVFLNAVRKSDESVTMFLVNGVMLQGDIVAFDLFCMLLERERQVQLVVQARDFDGSAERADQPDRQRRNRRRSGRRLIDPVKNLNPIAKTR